MLLSRWPSLMFSGFAEEQENVGFWGLNGRHVEVNGGDILLFFSEAAIHQRRPAAQQHAHPQGQRGPWEQVSLASLDPTLLKRLFK